MNGIRGHALWRNGDVENQGDEAKHISLGY